MVDLRIRHRPVMVKEVLSFLHPVRGVFVDATVGTGGHARAILNELQQGSLIGIDQDAFALCQARMTLEETGKAFTLLQGNFRHLQQLLSHTGVRLVDGILMDLGVSSLQLETPERGFSFLHPGPLDMRMDTGMRRTARELLESSSLFELERIFREYGEERWARRIARRIVWVREKKELPLTTVSLADLVKGAVPVRYRGRIHPATRVFQALRIAVNDELNALREGLEEGISCLRPGGRLLVIAYHSLEDRIVKQTFRRWEEEAKGEILKPFPVFPPGEEVEENRRGRSARLRAFERRTLE